MFKASLFLVFLQFVPQVLFAESPEPPVVLRPCDTCVSGVENFARVSESIWRGGQPSAEGFQNLKRMGVKTVVSFRSDHDDAPLLQGTGLNYVRIPSRAWRGSEKNVIAFLKLTQNRDLWPIFIHCAQGRDRTGYNVAAYRMVHQGWTAEQAIQEMLHFRFNQVWIGNPRFLRQLNVAKLKRSLGSASAPQVVVVP